MPRLPAFFIGLCALNHGIGPVGERLSTGMEEDGSPGSSPIDAAARRAEAVGAAC